MGDIWLLVLIVIVGIVLAIEGLPDGFGNKVRTFVTALAVAARSMIKRVASMIMVIAKRIGHRIRQQTFSAPSPRVVIGTAAAVVASPFAAIPMIFVFALLLYALNLIGGDEYSFVTNRSGTLRYILGYTFVIWVATLDIVFRWAVVALPFFTGLGFIVANHASRSNRFVRKLALSSLLIGGVYPLIFLLSAALGAFNEPIFN